MTWTLEKSTGDLVWSGIEQGIAPSPHKGVANIQGGNINTELGEVLCSFSRVQQSQQGTTSPTHTIDFLDTSHLSTSFALFNGMWITISASTISGLSTGNYYIQNSNSSTQGQASTSFQISSYYNGTLTSGFGSSGSASFTLIRSVGQPIAYATEPYFTTTQQYRYYVLDNAGLVWIYDTARVDAGVTGKIYWFLPDFDISYWGSDATPSGLGVLNGNLMVFSGNKIWTKPTVNLGGTTSTSSTYTQATNMILSCKANTPNTHFVFTGHQGTLYYTDGQYVGAITPDTTLLTAVAANVQSYAKYTTSTTTGTISTLISGSIPSTGANIGATGFVRIPSVFFTDQAGTLPAAITANTVYYIEYSTANENFQVFAAITGGPALDITSSAAGNQYFNTFWTVGTFAGYQGTASTTRFSPQAVAIQYGDIATSLVEVGNNILIGAIGNVVYPWNQVDPTPSGLIFLPESNVASMVTVNQVAYLFAGNRGNVYLTDGSLASLVIKVPDYCAGVAGTQNSYIEPIFTWGGSMYLRGRVYFSILDQTSTKAGNCGGVWSFTPTQNLYIGNDVGIQLRLENQNSYATYSGVATVLIPQQTQNSIAPQYWSGWYSSTSSPTYGVDFSGTTPSTAVIVETDILETGTLLGEQKQSFSNIEYKVAAPLASGDTVALNYRLNLTDAFATCGTIKKESATGLSGYCSPLPFEKTQWLQFQAVLTPNGSSSSSFVRLTGLRLRKA